MPSPAAGKLTTALTLLLLAAVSWWLAGLMSGDRQTVPPPDPYQPDYVIENFSATIMDTQGKRKYILNAQRLRHYPDDGRAELDRPHLIQFDERNGPVHTRAEHGLMPENQRHIQMWSNVKVTRGEAVREDGDMITADRLEILLQ